MGLSVDADVLKKEDKKEETTITTTTTTSTPTVTVTNPNNNTTTTTTPVVTFTTMTTNNTKSNNEQHSSSKPSSPADPGLSDGEDNPSKSSFNVVGPSKEPLTSPLPALPTTGTIFKLNINIVDNWKLRVPISENASIQQLMVCVIVC
jgi:hypothetical protein